MKKNIILLFALIAFIACEKTEPNKGNKETFRLYASSLDTKTENDGLSTLWSSGDRLMVYHAANGTTTYVKDGRFNISDTSTGLSVPNGADPSLTDGNLYDWYVFYPYAASIKVDNAVQTIGSQTGTDQEQVGNNSMKHLAGSRYPLYGKVEGIKAGEEYPKVNMKNLASILECVVSNNSPASITVTKVEVTAPQKIVGGFTVNYSTEPPVLTASATAGSTASLAVAGGDPIVVGAAASFYIGVAPFTLSSGETLKIVVTASNGEMSDSQEFTFEASEAIEFSNGKIRKLNLLFDVAL